MPWPVVVAAVLIGAATAVIHYLGLIGFSNDHYLQMACAQQMLLGEWPTRDFVDLGAPLTCAASAGAQLVFGRTLFAEAMLVTSAFAISASAVVVAAWQVSRSLVAGIAASLLVVIAFPRLYAYPKLFLYAVAPLLIWAWMRRPNGVRLVALAGFVAIAFLFRHDHGVYLGLASAVAIASMPVDRVVRSRHMLAFAGLVMLFLVPYFVYLQMNGGLVAHFRDSLAFSQRESDRTRLSFAAIAASDEARLYFLVRALPLVAVAWLVVDWWREKWSSEDEMAVPLVVLAFVVSAAFLRDPLSARIPDVIVPVALVGAWLAGRSRLLSNRPARVACLTALLVVAAGGGALLAANANAAEHLHRTNLRLGIGEVPRLFREKTLALTMRFARAQVPDGRILQMVPFFEYLDRCTTTGHRLLVAGNAPEVYVYAQRPFAAGHPMLVAGFFQAEHDQRLQLERAERQVVAFAVLLSDQYSDWRASFPRLNEFVESRFRPLTDITVDEHRSVRVLVHAGLPPTRNDRETGWPCYR